MTIGSTGGWWLEGAALAVLVLLCLWGIGETPFLSVNEARRAVAVREMFAAGEWLVPTMNGSLYLSKPPMFYWLALTFAHLFGGISEWVVRLPSVLFAIAICIAGYLTGAKLGGRRAGIYAALFLGANAGFSMLARSAEIEMTLAGLCLFSLLAAWPFLFGTGGRRWVLLSYALLGGALLTKGPVSLLFVSAPILLFAVIGRQRKAWLYLGNGWGWLLALAIGSSWYLCVSLREGWGVWSSIIQEDIVTKVGGLQNEAWYSYLLYLAGDFFPFWLVLLFRPGLLWRKVRARPELQLLACSVLLPLLVFSLFADKHAKYMLPAYPAVALLLACHWVGVLDAVQGWKQRVMAWLPPLLLLCFVGFYGAFESRAFAHRIQALPQIRTVMAGLPGLPAYALRPQDIRLVYYADRPVTVLTEEQVLAQRSVDALLVVDGKLPERLASLEGCTVARFEPYLAKKKTLQLIRLGPSCQH